MNMAEPNQFIQKALRGSLRHRVDMSKHTSWRAGGVADRIYQPADLDDLILFLQNTPANEPLYAVGLGSNLLVRDGGLRGTVLLLHGVLDKLRLEMDGSVYCEAGVPGAKLARFGVLHNLQGAEFFAGIPGTLGGMLAMNAGCYGSQTWDKVQRVQTINRLGEVREREVSDYMIGYRHVALCDRQEEWFVAAWLKFSDGAGVIARQEIKALLSNPEGDHAARLIEQCGLKGQRSGGAQVSEKHANFIVNLGTATASDIERLINRVQATVEQQTGVRLQCEVRIIGEPVQGGLP